MNTTALELENIYDLAYKALSAHGCDHFNADSVATTVSHAERDGSVSHGLFRIPGYVASLKSKKVNGVSRPSILILHKMQFALKVIMGLLL